MEVESTTSANSEMPVEMITEAELFVESQMSDSYGGDAAAAMATDPVGKYYQAADRQIYAIVDWAKRIPHFTELPIDDQVCMLRAGRCCEILLVKMLFNIFLQLQYFAGLFYMLVTECFCRLLF